MPHILLLVIHIKFTNSFHSHNYFFSLKKENDKFLLTSKGENFNDGTILEPITTYPLRFVVKLL